MRIGDEVLIRGIINEIRKDIVIIENEGGYFGTVPSEIIEKKTEWIDVKDELPPEKPGEYLITWRSKEYGGTSVGICDWALFTNGKIEGRIEVYDWDIDKKAAVEVVAWSKLPEPYLRQ